MRKVPSYAARLREALTSLPIRKKCCAHALDDASKIMELPDPGERAAAIAAYPTRAKCASCVPHFVRGLFLLHGTLTDPHKRYHLEFTLPTAAECAALSELLGREGGIWRQGERKGRPILYLKDGEAIADFLAYIGANQAAFDFMNNRIEREFRNNINRQVNCDTANIEKSLLVSERQIRLIRKMEESGDLQRLPEPLRVTARLRMNNEQLSLSELGEAHEPPITKSGVSHRLAKIESIAASLGIRGD